MDDHLKSHAHILRHRILERADRESLCSAANALCRQAATALDAEACILRVVDGPDGLLAGAWGDLPDPLHLRLPWDRGLSRVLVRERKPVRVVDVRLDDRTMRLWQEVLKDRTKWHFLAFAGVPLIAPENVVTGLAGVYMRTCTRAFMPEDIETLQRLFDPVADVLPLVRELN